MYFIHMRTIPLDRKIRAKMINKGLTGAAIARKVGVDRTAISKTVHGKIKSFRLRKAIAEAIGVKVTDLWPEVKNKE